MATPQEYLAHLRAVLVKRRLQALPPGTEPTPRQLQALEQTVAAMSADQVRELFAHRSTPERVPQASATS